MHILEFCKQLPTKSQAESLIQHADNCSGQNKNRYNLWFLAWLVCYGHFKTIELRFLVAGHTKNTCDGVIGHIKKKFRKSEVLVPEEMNQIIDDSSTTNSVVYCRNVRWKDWKSILSEFFRIPNELKINQYHVFRFESNLPVM